MFQVLNKFTSPLLDSTIGISISILAYVECLVDSDFASDSSKGGVPDHDVACLG